MRGHGRSYSRNLMKRRPEKTNNSGFEPMTSAIPAGLHNVQPTGSWSEVMASNPAFIS